MSSLLAAIFGTDSGGVCLFVNGGFVARNSPIGQIRGMLKPANTFWGPHETCQNLHFSCGL